MTECFDLNCTVDPKPVISADDFHTVLHHHWAKDLSVFPQERQRVQFATILLVAAYTGTHPRAILEPQDSDNRWTFRYEHIELLIIPDPAAKENKLLVMNLKPEYIKGNGKTGSRP